MKYTTRVSLTMEELVTLLSSMEVRINDIYEIIGITGDPNGYQKKNREKIVVLYNKFKKALERV